MRVSVLKQCDDGCEKLIDITEHVESISVKIPDDPNLSTACHYVNRGTVTLGALSISGGDNLSFVEIIITFKEGK